MTIYEFFKKNIYKSKCCNQILLPSDLLGQTVIRFIWTNESTNCKIISASRVCACPLNAGRGSQTRQCQVAQSPSAAQADGIIQIRHQFAHLFIVIPFVQVQPISLYTTPCRLKFA